MAAKAPAKSAATPAKPATPAPAKSAAKPAGGGMRMMEAAIDNLKLEPCKFCGRKFAADRVATHQQICSGGGANKQGKGKGGAGASAGGGAKSNNNQRKKYDSAKHRLSGTVAESYLKKPNPGDEKPPVKNWRQKHQELLEAVKTAKQVDAHFAAGGKAADLPPPPPSDYSDYVECPFCGRRFNQDAAQRHIPACKDMVHNKPGGGGFAKPGGVAPAAGPSGSSVAPSQNKGGKAAAKPAAAAK